MFNHRTNINIANRIVSFDIKELGKPNRFQRMALTHPKQYDFCIHKLGCGKVLDFLGVPYAPNGGEPIP